MFFAVDPWSPGAISSLIECAIKPGQDGAVHPILLIDGAFDASFLGKAFFRRHKRHALYEGTSLSESGAVGLWLIELGSKPEEIASDFAALKQSAGEKPMWSLLVSAVTAEAMVKHLRPFLFARTTDGIDWPVRWGDARVLPCLLTKLTEEERSHLMRPLVNWCHLDRLGNVRTHDGHGRTELPASPWRIWELDDQRFHALVDDGEADHIIGCIDDVRPDLLKACAPAKTHQLVQACLKLAERGGISAAPHRQALAMLGLMLDERFMQHPAFLKLLEKTRQGSSYEQELHALPDEFWSDCARMPVSAPVA